MAALQIVWLRSREFLAGHAGGDQSYLLAQPARGGSRSAVSMALLGIPFWGITQFIQADRVPKLRYPAIAAFAARLELLPEFVAYPLDRE